MKIVNIISQYYPILAVYLPFRLYPWPFAALISDSLGFPNFALGDASDLSAGMLVKYDDESPLASGTVYDILMPNLYCVLALEAIGPKISDDKSQDLTTLMGSQYTQSKYTKLSRFLSQSFPDTLKELFEVSKESTNVNSPYRIGTQFPKLLLAVLAHANISPLSENDSTKNSMTYSRQFYDACIEAIAPNDSWYKRSFVEYYLFERIFRLNAKLTLCWAEYNAKQVTEDGQNALSPKLLADFFFQSPLVLFPKCEPPTYQGRSSQGKGKLLHLFYEQWPDFGAHIQPTKFLHFLIQLSSFWFPQVLGILRIYMKDHKITSFDDVDRFFFPEATKEGNFSDFQKKYIPTIEEFSDYEKRSSQGRESACKLPRALTDRFLKRWKDFVPCSGYSVEAFTFKDLDDWKQKTASEYSQLQDHYAITEIQRTLF